jgi:hypothetical protein
LANAIAVAQNQNPLPPAHDIIPYCVSFWNKTKGGQDVASRVLKNVKADFKKLTPRGFLFQRFIMSALMNAHMVMRIINIASHIDDFSSLANIRLSLNSDASFFDFLREFTQNWRPDEILFQPLGLNIEQSFTSIVTDERASTLQSVVTIHPLALDSELSPRDQAASIYGQTPLRYRLQYLNSDRGRSKRLDTLFQHERISLSKAQTCPLCKGRTTSKCTICDVPACCQKKSGRHKTCWDKLHTLPRVKLEITLNTRIRGRTGFRQPS